VPGEFATQKGAREVNRSQAYQHVISEGPLPHTPIPAAEEGAWDERPCFCPSFGEATRRGSSHQHDTITAYRSESIQSEFADAEVTGAEIPSCPNRYATPKVGVRARKISHIAEGQVQRLVDGIGCAGSQVPIACGQ
jgi:hypothetical protein